jgi:hypothetical protein
MQKASGIPEAFFDCLSGAIFVGAEKLSGTSMT